MFRFRRTLQIAPGIRINFSKSSPSLSIGPRGASITLGKRGTFANVGVPGTGISYRTRLDGRSEQKPRSRIHSSGRSEARQRKIEERQLQREQERAKAISHRHDKMANYAFDLSPDGQLIVIQKNGGLIDPDDLKILFTEREQEITDLLQDAVDEINRNQDLILNIHLGAPNPSDTPELAPKPFTEPAPIMRKFDPLPAEPLPPPSEEKGFLGRLFSSSPSQAQIDKENTYHDAKASYNAIVTKRKSEESEAANSWEQSYKEWKKRKQAHDAQQTEILQKFKANLAAPDRDVNFMEDVLEDAFDSINWPRETIISFQMDADCKKAYIDVDLPEIEDFPDEEAKVASNKRGIERKNRSPAAIRRDYAWHIHGVIFLISATALSTVPALTNVIVSGFSQRRNKATSQIDDEYLLSVNVSRNQMDAVNFDDLEHLDLIETIAAWSPVREMSTTGVFKPIKPLEKR